MVVQRRGAESIRPMAAQPSSPSIRGAVSTSVMRKSSPASATSREYAVIDMEGLSGGVGQGGMGTVSVAGEDGEGRQEKGLGIGIKEILLLYGLKELCCLDADIGKMMYRTSHVNVFHDILDYRGQR